MTYSELAKALNDALKAGTLNPDDPAVVYQTNNSVKLIESIQTNADIGGHCIITGHGQWR